METIKSVSTIEFDGFIASKKAYHEYAASRQAALPVVSSRKLTNLFSFLRFASSGGAVTTVRMLEPKGIFPLGLTVAATVFNTTLPCYVTDEEELALTYSPRPYLKTFTGTWRTSFSDSYPMTTWERSSTLSELIEN